MASGQLVASFFTLSGAGFGEPPRNSFIERCEAAAAAGFTGIGLHADDLPRTIAAGVDIAEMQAVLRNNGLDLVEIEFLAGWAVGSGDRAGSHPTLPESKRLPTRSAVARSAPANSAATCGSTPRQRCRRGKAFRLNADRLADGFARRPRIVSLVGAHEHRDRDRPAPPRRRTESPAC